MREVVRASEIMEMEFRFQIERINDLPAVGTINQVSHKIELLKGYEAAARYTKVLGNYHRGRIDRYDRGMLASDQPGAIDESGRPAAYTTGEGDE